MYYAINQDNYVKIFKSSENYSKETIIHQYDVIYNVKLDEKDIYMFSYIPNELIKQNYLNINEDENIDDVMEKLEELSKLLSYFKLTFNPQNTNTTETNVDAYVKEDNVCDIEESTKLILEKDTLKLKIFYNMKTMKLYYYTVDNFSTFKFIPEMFPELTNVGLFTFKQPLETIQEKLFDKYYYSIEQAEMMIKNMTFNDSMVMNYENIVELFHTYFNFDSSDVKYDINNIMNCMNMFNTDTKIMSFYETCLKDYLVKNKIKSEDNMYYLTLKNPFIDISKQEPIDVNEFNELLKKEEKERTKDLII